VLSGLNAVIEVSSLQDRRAQSDARDALAR
jgi:hypothetical protein